MLQRIISANYSPLSTLSMDDEMLNDIVQFSKECGICYGCDLLNEEFSASFLEKIKKIYISNTKMKNPIFESMKACSLLTLLNENPGFTVIYGHGDEFLFDTKQYFPTHFLSVSVSIPTGYIAESSATSHKEEEIFEKIANCMAIRLKNQITIRYSEGDDKYDFSLSNSKKPFSAWLTSLFHSYPNLDEKYECKFVNGSYLITFSINYLSKRNIGNKYALSVSLFGEEIGHIKVVDNFIPVKDENYSSYPSILQYSRLMYKSCGSFDQIPITNIIEMHSNMFKLFNFFTDSVNNDKLITLESNAIEKPAPNLLYSTIFSVRGNWLYGRVGINKYIVDLEINNIHSLSILLFISSISGSAYFMIHFL